MSAAAQLFDLDGQVAIVTGASSGLGRHFALTLARHGAKVAAAARRAAPLDELVRRIAAFEVFHDKTLALAGRRQLRVAQADYSELSRLDVGSLRDDRFRD